MTGRTAHRRLWPAVVAGLLWAAAGLAQERTVHYYNPDWSPDGRTIVFESDREGELALYLVAADGGAVTRLTPAGLEAEVPRFSPDGEWITFVSRQGDGPLQLYRVRRDGSDLGRIAESERADYSASWSPDGTRLVFMSRPAGATVTHDLHVVTLNGRERLSITEADGNDLNPDWSPSGEWIAFIRGTAFHKNWPDLTEAEREEMRRSRDVWIVRPDGSDLTRITADDVPDCCPHWSPDGGEVLYRHGRDADAVVLALRPGGEPGRVAGPEVADPNPSPDGKRFVYTREQDGEWGVFVYERERGVERRIVPLGQADPAAEARASDAFLAIADEYRVPGLEDRRFTHDEYWAAVGSVLDDGDLSHRVSVTERGRSLEGRSIRAVTLGQGPVSALLWSQMHGDESTASMSLADIIHWWAASPEDDPLRRRLADRLTITMIPMLNPDGAERFIRHDALGVDVNRDARRLATPEGRILKAVRDSLQADFGFNLHDQGSRTAGPDGELVGIALLAPAADEERSWGPVRQRARRLSGVIAAALQEEIPGRIARYDDEFTPRAFGDNMQRWGTSTVLIESGALPDDPQKQELRRLNVLAILAALESIAEQTVETASPAPYDDLPMNVEITNDLLLIGGRVVMGDGAAYPLDVAIEYDDAVARTGPRYGEIGDLEGVRALETVDVTGLYLHPELDGGVLRRGGEVRMSVRRGADPGSELVRTIPGVIED